MTNEMRLEGNKLTSRIDRLRNVVKGVEDAIKNGCVLTTAIFTSPQPDKDGYSQCDIYAEDLPEINLNSCLDRMKARLSALEKQLSDL